MIAVAVGPGGELLHLVDRAPDRLPSVSRRDIEQAWEIAQQGGAAAAPRAFRFAGTPPVELTLNDQDAAAWAGALDLSTARGISICLRLLALIELMSRAAWTRAWFTLSRRGVTDIHPALLNAAALAPLNGQGGFDEPALRTLLPGA